MPDDLDSVSDLERDPTPILLWAYRRQGEKEDVTLICRPFPTLHSEDGPICMYVLNGCWEMKIADDGSVTAKHEPATVFEFRGFVWGYFKDGTRQEIDTTDAMNRFQAGERADPTICRCCLGTGRKIAHELVTLTARHGEHPIIGEVYEGGGFAGGKVHKLRCIGKRPGPDDFFELRTDYLVDGEPEVRHLQRSAFAGPLADYRHVPGEGKL